MHEEYSEVSGSDLTRIVGQIKREVLSGALTGVGERHENLPPSCSTGECRFDDFVSIGLCSRVVNVTDQLSVTQLPDRDWGLFGLSDNRTWNATLSVPRTPRSLIVPNLRALDFIFQNTNEEGKSLKFTMSDLTTSINDISMIYSNGSPDSTDPVTFHAVEISWFWCAKAFSVEMTAGTAHWTEKARSVNVTESSAQALNSLLSQDYWRICGIRTNERTCLEHQWGGVKLAPPPGYENHPTLDVEGLSSLGISAILQGSFWNGVEAPPYLKKILPSDDNDTTQWGGMFQLGHAPYRIQGDLSMAFAAALWPAMAHDSGDPDLQVESLQNLTENIAKGIEN